MFDGLGDDLGMHAGLEGRSVVGVAQVAQADLGRIAFFTAWRKKWRATPR